MRKYPNSIYSLSPFILSLTLVTTACTTTPEQVEEEASNAAETESVEMAAKMEKPSTQVYEVDNAEDVKVDSLPTAPQSNQASLKPSAPQAYIVKEGDTLWDISSQFLNQPWYWPEIWYVNPQVQNPHLIYPGDVINVFYVGGRPYLTVNEENRVSGIERLSPAMRGEPIDATEKIIPIQAIEQFLTRPLVVGADELKASPHIVASRDNRIIYGSNDIVYLRDAANLEMDNLYNIYRAGEVFKDPDSGEILGYEAVHLGDGKITKSGEPATLYVTDAIKEILRGDRVLKVEQAEIDNDFRPRSPEADIAGRIIYLYEAITQSGTYQVVVANVGEQHGIEKGHVLAINKAGRTVSDPYADEGQEETVTLPSERSADAIVYRVFDNLSYLFILDANRPVRNGDNVSNP